jgi:hypothetical protein
LAGHPCIDGVAYIGGAAEALCDLAALRLDLQDARAEIAELRKVARRYYSILYDQRASVGLDWTDVRTILLGDIYDMRRVLDKIKSIPEVRNIRAQYRDVIEGEWKDV